MRRRKIKEKNQIGFVFAAVSAVFLLLMVYTIYILGSYLTGEWTEGTIQGVEYGIHLQAASLQTMIELYGKDFKEQGTGILAELKGRGLSGNYYLCDADGRRYGELEKESTGTDRLSLKNGLQKRYGDRNYYTVFEGDTVSVAVPLDRNETCFLVEMLSKEEFAALALADMKKTVRYTGLFDSEGKLLVDKNHMEGSSKIKNNMITHAFLFAEENQKRQVIWGGFGGGMTVFRKMQVGDWFVGEYFPYSRLGAAFRQVLFIWFIIYLVFAALTAAIVSMRIVFRRKREKELAEKENVDPLTGICTFVGIERKFLGEEIEGEAKAKVKEYACICLDIVGFRKFNTFFGYQLGDQVLKVIGDVLKERYRFCARVSGDNFIIFSKIVPNGPENLERAVKSAIEDKIGMQYVQLLRFHLGVYETNDRTESVREVYDKAMFALNNAKKNMKQTIFVYNSILEERIEIQRNIEMHMMQALAKKEFKIYIQPKYSLEKNECVAGEALVRWKSEEMGLITPDTFIPLFEKNGFIVEVDFFVLEGVMQNISVRLGMNEKIYPISVNQSKVTILISNYLKRMEELVSRYKETVGFIELEVTETVLEDNIEKMVELLTNLKALGFKISLDDFGSGYSSFSSIRELPIDVLKIDRGFMAEDHNELRSKQIVKNIVNMAKELDIQVVCEGVETEEQFVFLKKIECDLAQGYLRAKPMPSEEFDEKYYEQREQQKE